ncbi:MAG: amino acid ABC transporter permease [Chloroflexota bacterium]
MSFGPDPRRVMPEFGKPRLVPFSSRISHLPWWALVAALLGVLFAWHMATDEQYQKIFGAISAGLVLTIEVTLIAYIAAVTIGLIVALGRVSSNVFLHQISTFYVEIVRGIPTLVLMFYIALAIIPAIIAGIYDLGDKIVVAHLLSTVHQTLSHPMTIDSRITLLTMVGQALLQVSLRDFSEVARVIIALTVAYSAFLAEIFRAGIEAVDRGQIEAARALGMTQWQAMRHIVLRQAVRLVLPPLGNDFISMLKDSSLVSALGVSDITLLGKLYASSTFLVFEPYTVVAYLYLVMTLLLSLIVKWIEASMARERRQNQRT